MLVCSRSICLVLAVLVVSAAGLLGDVVRQARRSYGLGELHTLAVSPDESRLATAGQTGAFLWDFASGQVRHRLEAHGVPVTAVAFSPDGRALLTGGRDGSIRLWAADTGASLGGFAGHEREINAFAFTPDGRSFVSASSDNSARVWSLESGALLRQVTVPGSFITDALLTPDDWRLVTADNSPTNNVALWDLATGERVRSFGEHAGTTRALALLPERRLATAGDDRRVHLWNLDTGQRIRTFEGATGTIADLVTGTNATTLIAGCLDGRVLVWDVASGAVLQNFKRDPLSALSVAAHGGRAVIATVFNQVEVLELATGAVVDVLHGHTTSTFTGVAFSPDERLILAGGVEKLTRLWNRTNAQPVRALEGHGAGTTAAAFSPDGARVLTTIGFPRKAARLWRTDTGELERELPGHSDWLTAAVFSADGSRVVTAAQDGTVRLWDAATGDHLRTFAGHVGAVFSVALSPDGALVAGGGGSFDPRAHVWDARTGRVVRTFEEDAGHVQALDFSPSGTELLVGWEGGLLRLFDVASGRLVREIVVPAAFLHTAIFSPDGAFILTGESFPFFTARLWDARSGEELRVFLGHTASVNAVAFNVRGDWILTAGDNVRLWDIRDLRARLRAARVDGGLELRWDTGALQRADAVAGGWTAVRDATSPWTVPLGQAAAFYRVAVPAAD